MITNRSATPEKIPLARGLLLALSVAMLHVAFLSRVVLFDARLEPLLLLGIVAALQLGAEAGAAIGFLAGLFADILGYGPLGPWTLVVALIGFGVGTARDNAFPAARERRPFVLVAVASAVGMIAAIVVSFVVADVPLPTLTRLLWRTSFVAMSNAVMLLLMRRMVAAAIPTVASRP